MEDDDRGGRHGEHGRLGAYKALEGEEMSWTRASKLLSMECQWSLSIRSGAT